MNAKENSPSKDQKPQPGKRRPRSTTAAYTAQEKCQTVLSVWSEKRSPSQICREMSITWSILNQWQERALEGMLQALEPRVVLDKGPALSPRLQAMLLKKRACDVRLTEKLKDLQQSQSKPQPSPSTVPGG